MRFFRTIAAALFLPAVLGIGLAVLPDIDTTSAEKNEVWISIDSAELEALNREGGVSGKVIVPHTIRSGIAVARIDESLLEELSALMHKHHHKCAGFISHTTSGDAIAAADALTSTAATENVVEYTVDNQANVVPMLAIAQEPKIRQTIIDMSSYDTRRHDSESGQLSANYINFKWGQLAAAREDMSVEFVSHPSNVTPQPSVVLTVQGTEFPDEYVILGGHQDSINSSGASLPAPGADDNASGIASLTEAIRAMVETGFRPKRTVQFMAYAAEEVGLKGSRDIAANYQVTGKNVVGVLQLDMTNYTSSTTVDIVMITDHTNAAQNQFVRDLIATYLPELTVSNSTCGYACSDHASWTEKGFASSFPHEGQLQAPRTSNTQIHKATDTISVSNNNANHALKFSKVAITFVGELAKGSVESSATAGAFLDFDGDGKTDPSVFRPSPSSAIGASGPEGSTSQWWIYKSSDGGNLAYGFGTPDDKQVAADFTGDGKTDVAFWRPSTGDWYILRSDDSSYFSFPFGSTGDIPAPGDFDGDGKADPAVFRPSSGTWFIFRSSDSQVASVSFGIDGDKPVVADYDGDGIDDLGVFRASSSQWWLLRSSAGVKAYHFGVLGYRTAVGDWTGDGTADVAYFLPSTSEFFVYRSDDDSYFSFKWGSAGDIPAPGDYDGDGQTDAAVWRPSDATWYILGSTSGFTAIPFGAGGDVPVPSSVSVQ